MKILWGLVGILLSYFIVRYRKNIVEWTGKFAWAERYLGMGGTYTVLIFLSIGVFMFSILYMTGNMDFVFGGLGNFFSSGS